MVRITQRPLKVGDHVLVPWGFDADKHGIVVDVWGDPLANVRVEIEAKEGEQPEQLLLNASVLTHDENA